MQVTTTALDGVLKIEPSVFTDDRGWFYESFNAAAFEAATGASAHFVQDDHSMSTRGVLRGLHYQLPRAQGKIVRVIRGEIFDVVVDLRRRSSTHGRWHSELLSAHNRTMLWIPAGFAHGFLTLSESAEVLYKVTDQWCPDHQHCIRWDDPTLAIRWPLDGPPAMSPKDRGGQPFDCAPQFD